MGRNNQMKRSIKVSVCLHFLSQKPEFRREKSSPQIVVSFNLLNSVIIKKNKTKHGHNMYTTDVYKKV